MGIFVDENDTFPIDAWYNEVRDERGRLRRVEVSPTPQDGWTHVRGHFCQPGSEVFGIILEEATIINSASLKPILQTRRLRESVLMRLMKRWAMVDDLADDPDSPEAETMLPHLPQTIAGTHWSLTNHLFLSYMEETKMEEVIDAAVDSEISG